MLRPSQGISVFRLLFIDGPRANDLRLKPTVGVAVRFRSAKRALLRLHKCGRTAHFIVPFICRIRMPQIVPALTSSARIGVATLKFKAWAQITAGSVPPGVFAIGQTGASR
jgi:hypothetical protein